MIAAAFLRAVHDAEAALSQSAASTGEDGGGGYIITDVECEVAGFVALAGPSVGFIPAGSVPRERPETMSTLRLRFGRVPAGLRTPV
ncbi:MAG TPA: hypothetical protein VEL12_15490 [Candidatus Nitrosopolaris sp.]|nr:hypothetical protein [Candidatus Nitrosopolaris sp.]